MSGHEQNAGLFPALLKHWRGRRGLSQLDLAIAAGVSNRHISFLETGRSGPSEDMVLRLGAALDVPLRHVNAMLHAAGHEPAYSDDSGALPGEIRRALDLMKTHHDPFPLVVIDRAYNLVDLNAGALALFTAVVPELQKTLHTGLNLASLVFDASAGAQQVLTNFDEVGRSLLWRIQREALADPENGPLHEVLQKILQLPTVADDWRDADLSVASLPTIGFHIRYGDQELRFLTTVTAFQAPQTVALDELRIETWFPADDATADVCRGFLPKRAK